ncbi:MAG: DNA-binding protein [Chloroflexi bacterium]|nr:MAG: DNA-binding protein [Chloroflexota bacterium]
MDPNELISQAEAARIRKVTKQAIAKLVKSGRLRSISVGGHILIYRVDVENFQPKKAGRKKKDTIDDKN